MTKFKQQDQQAIVNILLRYWEEISAIEQEFALRVGAGDMRPRIDYFHDAIRAYTTEHKSKDMESRLAVEQLAYDLRCLRYLATMPLASITHDTHNLSPQSLPAVIAPGLVETSKRIDRETKMRLTELYEQYGVLFASLLRETVNNDHYERSETINEDVTLINQIIAAIEGSLSAQEVASLAVHLKDPHIRQEIMSLLPAMKGKSLHQLNGLIARLKSEQQRKDRELKNVDLSHHNYSTTQLMLYESAREMLMKMAAQGMNLVGQFVESTLRQGQQGRGR
ncbi:MAG: hypothetical protein SFX19_02950 [Alphaproteobacteria bacterium]|nr:hypothetical protein [Alphaproteobacteria bacterium]